MPTVFTKNRDRLLTTEMARKGRAAMLAHREVAPLLLDDHFLVDGTLVKEAEDAPPDDGPEGRSANALAVSRRFGRFH